MGDDSLRVSFRQRLLRQSGSGRLGSATLPAMTAPKLPALDPKKLDEPTLEALIEMMFLAVNADGEFSDAERVAFAGQVAELSGGRVAGERFRTLAARIEKDATQGRTARLEVLKKIFTDPTLAVGALGLVVRMVAADGIIRTAERELILEVAEGLGIEGDVAADLVAHAAV